MALPPLSSRTVWLVALEADVEPAAVRRRHAGEPLAPSVVARIERAAVKLGVTLAPRAADPCPGTTGPDDAA